MRWYDYLETPIGELLLVVDMQGLAYVGLPQSKHRQDATSDGRHDSARLGEVKQQFADWFAGKRQAFDLPLHPVGTPFQQAVWQGLMSIPYGQTISYGELATAINKPKAVRAVGTANGANPLSIVIPCHRVIGKDGSLTGYGGGLEAKQWLLEHEKKVLEGMA